MAIRNAGTTTMRFKEGIFVEGDSVHGNANQLVVSGSISVMGTGVANSYSAAPTNGTYDRNEWYYIPGNVQDPTNTSYEPRTPSSPVPVDDGSTTSGAFYTFWGGNIHISNVERMISLKTGVSGTVTISFKIIAGGNNDGSGSNNQSVTETIPLANSTTTPSNFAHANRTWTSGSANTDRPVQIAYATTGYEQSDNWTAVSSGTSTNFRGHYNLHPDAADQNLNVQECTSVSYTITGVSGTFYVGIIQDDNGASYNSWAITDLVIEEGVDEGYVNFEGTSFSEGSDGFGFRNNGGQIEFKDEGGSWTGLGDSAPAGQDGAIQYNNNGALGGGNFFYDTNTANIGIGDFTNSDPSYLFTIQGDKGGTGNNAYVNIIEHNDSTGPAILYQRKRGSLASPTNIQDDDILGTDTYIGQVGGASLILGGFSTRYHSTDGTYMTFSVKGPSDSGNTNKLMLRDPSLMPHPDITTGNVGAFVLGAASNAFDSIYVENIRAPNGENLKFLAENNATIMTVGTQGTYANNIGIGMTTPEFPLVVQGSHTTDPDLHIRNGTTSGPILRLSRIESQITDVLEETTLAEIQLGASVDEAVCNIRAVATEDWEAPVVFGDPAVRGTRLEFETTYGEEGTTHTGTRLRLDHTLAYFSTNLECLGSLTIGSSFSVGDNINVDNNLNVLGSLVTNGWSSNDDPSTIDNAYQLMAYTDQTTSQYSTASNQPTIRVNPSGVDLDFVYQDDNSNHTFHCRASDGQTFIGSFYTAGPQYSAHNASHDHGGLYVESNSPSGATMSVVNRDTDHNGDGIQIVIGRGRWARATDLANYGNYIWRDEPQSTNYWIKMYGKDRGSGFDDFDTYDEFNPDDVFFAGGFQGDGSGGIDSQGITFTGTHDSMSNVDIQEGMIVESTGNLWLSSGMSLSLPSVVPSSSLKSKKVYGVVGEKEIHSGRSQKVPEGSYGYTINSLGEGKVWVTNLDGEPSNGDYITSSPITGYGQLQDDDILHSYTVAKLTESIDWDTVSDTINHEGATYKRYLAGCTYHCG